MWSWLLCAAWAGETELQALRQALHGHVQDEHVVEGLLQEALSTGQQVEQRLSGLGETEGLSERLLQQMTASLAEKAGRLPLEPERIRRTVLGYEAFKLEAYVTSGVFPKKYFGYLDGQADTAEREIRVMQATRRAVEAANRWLEQNRRSVRITEAEVAVTFLAEGGALWLPDERPFHPVMDVGLDDLALGHRDQPGLLAALDEGTGSGLLEMVAWYGGQGPLPRPSSLPDFERWLRHDRGDEGPFPYLTRAMTLEETVVGTALMYVWEKEIAQRKLKEGGHRDIMERPLEDQFVIASLIYNSGLLHEPSRWKQILSFSTGQLLYDRSQRNKATRPELNLLPPARQLAEFRERGAYREQPTSWVAVYHVLQRYGGFAALYRFTDTFDASGRFRVLPSLPAPAPAPPSPALSLPPSPALSSAEPAGACGCSLAQVGRGGWLGALLLAAWVMCGRWSDGSSSSRSSSIGGSSPR